MASTNTARSFQRRDVFVVSALLLLSGLSASASQIPDLTKRSLEDLMNINITSVSKKEQKVSQVAAAVFVISREDMIHSGATNIPDLLRMVPGLDVAQIDASNWAISSRGFNGQYSNKLLVLVDGRTVYSSIFAGVFWDSQDIPLDSIDRIEVIRGPGAAVWGSNAVNGVVNIITLNAAATQGGYVSGEAGNTSVGPETIRFGGKARLVGPYRVFAEGFHINSLPALDGLNGQDDWRLIHGGFRTDSSLSARDSLTTEGEVFEGNAGDIALTPISLAPPENAALAMRTRYFGWNLLTRWTHTSSVRSETSLLAFFDRTKRGDSTGEDSTYDIGQSTFNIDFQHHVAAGSTQDIVWGLGFRISTDAIHPTLRISASPDTRRTQLFSSFVQDEFNLRSARVHLVLSARIEHSDFTGFDLQPSARLTWVPDAKDSLWASLSGADRTPARADSDIRVNFEALPGPGGEALLVSLFGNPNQKNEHLTALETGYRKTWTSKFSLDSAIFFNRYRDLVSVEPGPIRIESIPAPEHYLLPETFGNGLYGETHGIEVFADWKVEKSWTLKPGYSFFSMHLHQFPGSQDSSSAGQTEGGTPDHQAQLRSDLRLPRNVKWNMSAYFVNRLPEQVIPSYVRVDTGLTWLVGENVSLDLRGQNLSKTLHPEYSGPNSTVQSSMMRRDVTAKVAWSF